MSVFSTIELIQPEIGRVKMEHYKLKEKKKENLFYQHTP